MRINQTYLDGQKTSKYWEDSFTDESAASYMATYGEGPGSELRFKLGELLRTGDKVLDVGCGPGWNLDHFMEHGPAVTYKGLDYSDRFVKVANQRHPREYAHDEPFFSFGDARSLKESRESYDVVILQDCLEHTNGYEKPLKEALRVAKRRVIITFWHLEDTDDPHINDDGSDTWGAWYDKREWEAYLDTLSYPWLHERLDQGQRHRDIYVIDKEAS